jgi:hypothetical protein
VIKLNSVLSENESKLLLKTLGSRGFEMNFEVFFFSGFHVFNYFAEFASLIIFQFGKEPQ